MPIAQGPLPGVTHTEYQKWEESSSSASFVPYQGHPFQAPQYGQPSEIAGAYNPYAQEGNVPPEYYQQPLVQYGQMPVEKGFVAPQSYGQESSSDYMGTTQQPYTNAGQKPYNLPYQEDCGCGGPSIPQTGYSAPDQGFTPQWGGYPSQGPGGFGPGAGAAPIQPGYGPELGGYPASGGFGQGAGFAPTQSGYSPELGGYPAPGGFGPGAGFASMQSGYGPELGRYPAPGGFGPGAGFAPMQPGYGPELGGYPVPVGFGPAEFNQGFPMGPVPTERLQNPYPQGVVGNTPSPYPLENEELGTNSNYQRESFDTVYQQPMTPPVYGPGGTAPVYTPSYSNFVQPPFINPYGMDAGNPFGMPRYQNDESSDYGS
jgi:morphogenetic protein associated with SpoVID